MKIDVYENGITAWREAIESLNDIINGQTDFSNYRKFILNFHGALELLFKKMLIDKAEFMIFSFEKFKEKVLPKYSTARKVNKSIFEYASLKEEFSLPNTVTFEESYQRLAYLYNIQGLTEGVMSKLKELNNLRNNIMHFQVEIKDEQFINMAMLLLECNEVFNDNINEYYEDDYISYNLEKTIKSKDLAADSILLNNELTKRIIEVINEKHESFLEIDVENYEYLAEIYLQITGDEEYSLIQIAKHFARLLRHNFIEMNYFSVIDDRRDEVYDLSRIHTTEKYQKLLDENI